MAKNLLQNSCDLVPVQPLGANVSIVNPQGLVFIQKNTLSSGSASFTGLANYPYKNYRLIFSGSAGASGNFFLKLSTDNGNTFLASGYQSGIFTIPYNSATINNQNNNTFFIFITNTGGNPTGINLDLYNINSNTRFVCIGGSYTYYDGTNTQCCFFCGAYTTLITANAIQVAGPASGTSGTVYLYGYNS